jgi:ABC-type branched-subunit amino acid transport system substrate-binding protein
MKRGFAIAALATLLLAACGAPTYTCTDPLGCLEIPPGSPVLIGVLYTDSGYAATVGLGALEGVERAVTEKGDLLGHSIELRLQATDCTPDSAREAATELARTPGLAAVIGPTCITDAFVANPILLDAGLTVVGPIFIADATLADRPDAYFAANFLFSAIERTVFRSSGTIYIPRLALREALKMVGDKP